MCVWGGDKVHYQNFSFESDVSNASPLHFHGAHGRALALSPEVEGHVKSRETP